MSASATYSSLWTAREWPFWNPPRGSPNVRPGPHRVSAHNTVFWKTHDLVRQPGEHARFVAINKAGCGRFAFILGAAPLYLTFERDS